MHETFENIKEVTQIDSSTKDGSVEFAHSQYACIMTSQVSIVNNSNECNFCVLLFFFFTLFI